MDIRWNTQYQRSEASTIVFILGEVELVSTFSHKNTLCGAVDGARRIVVESESSTLTLTLMILSSFF